MLLATLCAGVLLSLQIGCYSKESGVSSNLVNKKKEVNNVQANIDSETAILIAKGAIALDYDIRDYSIEVKEEMRGWRVAFRLKDQGMIGGEPSFLIDKTNGKLLEAYYPK